LAALTLATTFTVRADESEADFLLRLKPPERTTVRYDVKAPEISSISFGGGKTAVRAPVDVVRQVVTEYGSYKDFMPKFQKSLVVGKTKEGGTDVYLQVPIVHGAITLWAVTRFGLPRRDGNVERIEGAKVEDKGNVQDLRAIWRFYPVGEDKTILKLELLIVPSRLIPVPGSVVTEELAYAADEAVAAVRDRAQARYEKQKGAAHDEKDSDD
jgi:ribosome-associated toxin RatA of RatAB toxin-antitoxin module